MVQSLGQVDWDDFDNLQEVMTWMVTIITFDLFLEPVEEAGLFIIILSFTISKGTLHGHELLHETS